MIYAVGDVHGCHDLLIAALDRIEAHAGPTSADVMFLGDYIDRGPQSRQVVETLMAGPRRSGDSYSCLKGNHEDMALAAHDGEPWLSHWLANGGTATIGSYGGSIPPEHLDWMRRLPLMIKRPNHLFVHAGLNPLLTLEEQTAEDLLWIRAPFLSIDHDFGWHVVHGHTPNEHGPELRSFRTNLDTGAFFSGKLCVGVFDPSAKTGPVATETLVR